MRLLIALFSAAALCSVVAACTTSPTGRTQLRLVSDAQLNQMGAAAFTQMKQELPPARSADTRAYVQCVTQALLPQVQSRYQWELQVFESNDVNAFALPGGKIGVYTGLLRAAQTPGQLAAVIGHEIAHVVAGHSAARVSNQMATQFGAQIFSAATGMGGDLIGLGANLLLVLPNSRGDETEADVLGMEYMARAGFDPREAVTLWENMARIGGGRQPAEFTSTHPSHSTRIRDLNAQLPKVTPIFDQARASGRRPGCKV
jgi:predicted Zn-dependent protease